MRTTIKIKDSFWKRILASLLVGKYVSKRKWTMVITKQVFKGYQKYGHDIDECPYDKFNWTDMMLEEIIDYMFYKIKSNGRTFC